MTPVLIRFFDILLSLLGLVAGLPLLILLTLLGFLDTGAPIFRQLRVGRYQKPFMLVKFRTMKKDTKHVASHLISRDAITPLGRLLRRTKLDELPQLWNVLKGEMSLVGPRPCLYSQENLIHEREKREVFSIRPGITGLAQISEVDMSTPLLLAETDRRMIDQLTVINYWKYILMTIHGKGRGDGVK